MVQHQVQLIGIMDLNHLALNELIQALIGVLVVALIVTKVSPLCCLNKIIY